MLGIDYRQTHTHLTPRCVILWILEYRYICVRILQSPERVVVSQKKTSKYEIMKNKLDKGVKKIVLEVNPVNDRNRVFTLWQLICFGVLTTPLAMAGFAFVMFVPTFYAIDMGLGLGLVGMVFVFGRLFDVVTDPVIGYLSDETRSRFGPRKPWMILGVPGFCLASWMLLAPPEGAGLAYLLIASTLYFLFYTIVDVPYSSIGLEISPHIHERTFLASSKAVFQIIGALLAGSLPFILTLPVTDALPLTAKIIAGLSVFGLVLFLFVVPSRPRVVTVPRIGLLNAFKLVWQNKPYRYLIGTFFIVQTANALTAGLTVLFVTHVIKAPELIGMFLGLMFLSTALCLPIWIYLSKRFSKKRAWRMSILTGCYILAFIPLLGPSDVIGLAVISIILGGAFGCDAIMPTSMLADIIYAEEEGGKSRLGGLSLAVKNAVSKMAFIAPMGLAFPVLGAIGFDKQGVNDNVQLMTLVFFYAILPIVLRISAFFVLKNAPIISGHHG